MNGKQLAAERAVDYIEDGMVVGLGTGSTVYWAILRLAERVKQGLRVRCVPTSQKTEQLAIQLGISLISPAEMTALDVTIDGADEVNPTLDLIKGGGGALVREKIVASHSRRFIVVVDESKEVPVLGRFPLPVEVIPFGWEALSRRIESLGCTPQLRMDQGTPYRSDNGNYILDCAFSAIPEPESLNCELHLMPGVVETGLFIGMAERVIIGGGSGVQMRQRAAR